MAIVWSIVQAVFVRCLLFIHSILCIWRAVDVQENSYLWFLTGGNILHIVETEHRILKKRGKEDKWFCMCFFIHLLNTVPAIWLVEMDRLEKFQTSGASPDGNITTSNTTTPSNVTDSGEEEEALSSIQGITLPVRLDADTWASVLEQGFLFILILGRWILPRGKLTRDQLSQLLFVYIGSGSDVVELFIIFEEPEIRKDRTFSYAILAVWSVSLLQFTLVLTSTRKPRGGKSHTEMNDYYETEPEHRKSMSLQRCCVKMVEMEIWSLFVAMVLQDGPYLTIRLCAIFVKNVTSYGILFFASKNILMLMMLLYRCLVIATHKRELKKKLEKEKEAEENEDPKLKNSKKKGRKGGGKGRENYRWSTESPPHYWSYSNYQYPMPYGMGQSSYGYNGYNYY